MRIDSLVSTIAINEPTSPSSNDSQSLSSSFSSVPTSNLGRAAELELYRPDKKTHKSAVWQYFRLSRTPDLKHNVYCIVPQCSGYVYVTSNTTSSLLAHLDRHHPACHIDSPTAAPQRKFGLSKEKKKQYDSALAKLFVANAWSFNSVEKQEMKDFALLISGGIYTVPGRTALTGVGDNLYTTMVQTLLSEVETQCVSITTDAATLRNDRSYVAVTGHYITAEWQMRDVVLAVLFADASHTGQYVSDLLDRVIEEWTLSNRAFSIVTDNGSNFTKAARINTRVQERQRCAIHTYQLCLRDAAGHDNVPAGVPSFGATVDRARALVTAIRRSPTLSNRLAELQAEVRNELHDVGFDSDEAVPAVSTEAAVVASATGSASLPSLPSSSPASSSWPSSSSSSPSSSPPPPSRSRLLVLVKDVSTRFNSTCLVFSRLLRVRESVTRLCRATDTLASVALTEEEWSQLDSFNRVLLWRPGGDGAVGGGRYSHPQPRAAALPQPARSSARPAARLPRRLTAPFLRTRAVHLPRRRHRRSSRVGGPAGVHHPGLHAGSSRAH